MKHSMKLAVVFLLALGMAAMALSTAALADGAEQGSATHFIDGIEGIHTAQQATVILMPERIRFYFTHNSEQIWEYGCKFVTRGPEQIAALVELLNHADVTAEIGVGPLLQSRAPGEQIVLLLADGTEITFWFYLPSFGSSVAPGRFSGPRGSGMNITANASQLDKLFAWARKVGEPSARDVSRKRVCEDRLRGVSVK